MSHPEPLSPEDRERIVALASANREMPKTSAAVGRLLTLADSLAARVRSLEAERDQARKALDVIRHDVVLGLAPAMAATIEKHEAAAQEVRRAWDAMGEAGDRLYTITGGGRAEAEQEYSDLFDEARAAIDALVPPVPAAAPQEATDEEFQDHMTRQFFERAERADLDEALSAWRECVPQIVALGIGERSEFRRLACALGGPAEDEALYRARFPAAPPENEKEARS